MAIIILLRTCNVCGLIIKNMDNVVFTKIEEKMSNANARMANSFLRKMASIGAKEKRIEV